MQKSSTSETRKGLLLTLVVLGLFAALIILPYQFSSEAGANKNTNPKGLFDRTEASNEPIYDIREDQSKEVSQALLDFRQMSERRRCGRNDREKSLGLRSLKKNSPSNVEYQLHSHAQVHPDVLKQNRFLSSPSANVGTPQFIKQHQLFGMTRAARRLEVFPTTPTRRQLRLSN